MDYPVVSFISVSVPIPFFLHDYLLLQAATEFKKRKYPSVFDVNSADHTPQEMWGHIYALHEPGLFSASGPLVLTGGPGELME